MRGPFAVIERARVPLARLKQCLPARLAIRRALCRCSVLALAVFSNVASRNARESPGGKGFPAISVRLDPRCLPATEALSTLSNVASALYVFFNSASARVASLCRNPYDFDRGTGRSSSEGCVRASIAGQRRAFPQAGRTSSTTIRRSLSHGISPPSAYSCRSGRQYIAREVIGWAPRDTLDVADERVSTRLCTDASCELPFSTLRLERCHVTDPDPGSYASKPRR